MRNNKPKVAVLLCGYLRTWDNTLQSFLNFMNNTDYDVFIHTYTTVNGYHPYIVDIYGITNNTYQASQDDIIKSLKIPYKKLVIEDDNDSLEEIKEVEDKDFPCYQWPDYDSYNDLQVLKGKGISIRTYLQYRKFRLCNDLRKEYEKETGIKYDYVIKLRMDLNYSQNSLISCLQNVSPLKVLTSSSNCQPNDHVYIGLPDTIDKLLNGLESTKFPPDREYNPHEYCYISLLNAGLMYDPCIHNLKVSNR